MAKSQCRWKLEANWKKIQAVWYYFWVRHELLLPQLNQSSPPTTHPISQGLLSLPRFALLLLLSCFSRVRLCATPQTAAPQAPPSLGFSRQEHWSGLPFPSPMHESEKWKWAHSVLSDSSRPHGLQPTRLLRPWDFPGKSTGAGCHCLLWFALPVTKLSLVQAKQAFTQWSENGEETLPP